MLLPSTYFAYVLYKQQQYVQNVNMFINHEFIENGNTIVYRKTDFKKSPRTLELVFLSRRFTTPEIDHLNGKLNSYGISNTKLIIKQDSIDNIELLKRSILNDIQGKEAMQNVNEARIKLLEAEISRNTFDNTQLFREAKAIFPNLSTLSLANHVFAVNDTLARLPVLVYDAEPDITKNDKLKFKNWIKQRLSIDTLIIIKN